MGSLKMSMVLMNNVKLPNLQSSKVAYCNSNACFFQFVYTYDTLLVSHSWFTFKMYVIVIV